MAAKIKCPDCGAKNPVTNHRCRLCTAVINPNAAAPVEEPPAPPLGVDHFDAGDINRQLQPVRERISSGNGALTARLAAAREGSVEPAVGVAPEASGSDLGFASETSFGEAPPRPPSAPSAAPIQYEDEPFDPDALFREMG